MNPVKETNCYHAGLISSMYILRYSTTFPNKNITPISFRNKRGLASLLYAATSFRAHNLQGKALQHPIFINFHTRFDHEVFL